MAEAEFLPLRSVQLNDQFARAHVSSRGRWGTACGIWGRAPFICIFVWKYEGHLIVHVCLISAEA